MRGGLVSRVDVELCIKRMGKKRFFRDLTTDRTFQIFDKYEYSALCIR
jgi:hypothetical protein